MRHLNIGRIQQNPFAKRASIGAITACDSQVIASHTLTLLHMSRATRLASCVRPRPLEKRARQAASSTATVGRCATRSNAFLHDKVAVTWFF